MVGGLGLGYTAGAVLADDRVRELIVVEALAPVIGWHRQELVPLGRELTTDPRCRLELGDFFAMSRESGFDPDTPDRRFDAVLVDIDHSPRHQLGAGNADFYAVAGVRRLAERLTPGGVFGLWSNDPPDQEYLEVLRSVFTEVTAEVVAFPNPLQQRPASNTVYLASGPAPNLLLSASCPVTSHRRGQPMRSSTSMARPMPRSDPIAWPSSAALDR